MRDLTIEERGYFWLSLVDGMATDKKHELLLRTGGIVELFTSFINYADEIISLAGNKNFAQLSIKYDSNVIDSELEKLDEFGVDFITIDDEYYPNKLRDIAEPPLVLYYKGDKSLLKDENSIAVVGTRRPNRYGKDITKFLVENLAKSGITIVSGLARGIDTISHRTTLIEGGRTIAVVANGLDTCYPSENHELMDDIGGDNLIISEYPIGAKPFAYRFPERNRIISGISKSVLVTQAGRHSGSLITLNCALEQGKNVYIVPGEMNCAQSEGSNDAIKELQGAMVTDVSDILKDYNVEIKDVEDEQSLIPLSEIEKNIVDFIKLEDRHIDEIVAYSKDMSINELLAMLSKLELYGLIQKLPGNYYGK